MSAIPEKKDNNTGSISSAADTPCASGSRVLTPLHVWALCFGCTVGWGAFVMPGTTFLVRGGPLGTFVAIQISIFVMLLFSNNYYYMIRRHPTAGGQYVYTRDAFGRTHGFVCAWFLALAYLSLIPLNATAIPVIVDTIFGDALRQGFHYRVAGYDVYAGEIIFTAIILTAAALIRLRGLKTAARLQTVFAFLMVGGIVLFAAAAMLSEQSSTDHFAPFFYPGDNSSLLQITSLLAIAPFLFIGFETGAQYAPSYRFRHGMVKPIMDFSLITGGMLYILLTLFAASVVPVGYNNWATYIDAIPAYTGANALPTLRFATIVLGRAGRTVFVITALGAVFTGINGFYLASSQLLSLLAQDQFVPAAFGKRNRHGAPVTATWILLAVSILATFFGRTVLNWIVDMCSVGAAVGYSYTSLAARKTALADKHRGMILISTVGAVFSLIFILLLLIPIKSLDCSLGQESYVCLFLWSVLGIVFYLYNNEK